MNTADPSVLLDRLRAGPRESEWVEFKATRLDSQSLGEYLSALANSVCLLGKPRGYLVTQRRIVDEMARRLCLVRGVKVEVDANLKRAQSLRQATPQRCFGGNSNLKKE